VTVRRPGPVRYGPQHADGRLHRQRGQLRDSDGSIASYAWAWGDGETSTGAIASHTYAAGGLYPVTLTVSDDDGATATATKRSP
jgi:chitodextrinase